MAHAADGTLAGVGDDITQWSDTGTRRNALIDKGHGSVIAHFDGAYYSPTCKLARPRGASYDVTRGGNDVLSASLWFGVGMALLDGPLIIWVSNRQTYCAQG